MHSDVWCLARIGTITNQCELVQPPARLSCGTTEAQTVVHEQPATRERIGLTIPSGGTVMKRARPSNSSRTQRYTRVISKSWLTLGTAATPWYLCYLKICDKLAGRRLSRARPCCWSPCSSGSGGGAPCSYAADLLPTEVPIAGQQWACSKRLTSSDYRSARLLFFPGIVCALGGRKAVASAGFHDFLALLGVIRKRLHRLD
jgi:hypothetical protein